MKVDSTVLANEMASIVRDTLDSFRENLNGPVIDFVAQSIHDGPGAKAQYDLAGIDEHEWAVCEYKEQYILDAYAATDAVLSLLMAVFGEFDE